MRSFLIGSVAAGILFLLAAPAEAQISITTKKVDDQRITTFEKVGPPDVIGKEFDTATAKGVVLSAKDWLCGTQFTDQKNRRWNRASGQALSQKPSEIPGWLIQTDQGRMYFMTTRGTLFSLHRIVAVKKE